VLAETPAWFADKIDLTNKTQIISLDDDSSIHQIWANRFSTLLGANLEHTQFHSGESFSLFLNEQVDKSDQTLFLIDFELLNQPMTGLDLIEKLNLSKNAILVTSRYEDKNIIDRSKAIGLRILPKSLAGQIPIKSNEPKRKYDLILLDDDALVRMTWEMRAKQKNKNILSLSSSAELWANIKEIDLENIIYIDVHLANEESGLDLSKELFNMGFKNLYLATGYEPETFANVTWIKGVIGKTPVI
jgi:hypothetical protein